MRHLKSPATKERLCQHMEFIRGIRIVAREVLWCLFCRDAWRDFARVCRSCVFCVSVFCVLFTASFSTLRDSYCDAFVAGDSRESRIFAGARPGVVAFSVSPNPSRLSRFSLSQSDSNNGHDGPADHNGLFFHLLLFLKLKLTRVKWPGYLVRLCLALSPMSISRRTSR